MKNGKSVFKILALTSIFLIHFSPAIALKDETKDSFEKTYKVSESDRLSLNMYESDLQINTWSNSEIKLQGEILMSGGSKEDVTKVLDAFKNPEISQGSGRIEINTNFIESSSNFSLFGLSKITKTKLSNGETVSINSIKANYTIWVPEKIAFELKSKYNSIKASNLLGKLDFELYNVDLSLGNFGDNSSFDFKYSTANMGSGSNGKFDVYDSKLFTDDLKKVIISSKYSTFKCKAIYLLALESYTDKFTVDNLNGIDIDAKYTTLQAKGNSNIGKFKLYDCNITVENFNRIEYDSKYSEFTASKVGSFDISESYNDTYEIREVGDFSCQNSKYNKVNIDLVNTSISLPDSYDSNFIFNKAGANFTGFKGDFKYGKVEIKIDPALNFKLVFENTYGEISYPKDRFKKPYTYIESDSKSQFEGSTDPNAKCEINFKTYDVNFTIE